MRGAPRIVLGLILALVLGAFDQSDRERVAIERLYTPVQLDTEMIWVECGTWNGFFFPWYDLIALCEENLDEGVEVARFIYLHELGHAWTFSRGFTYERWAGNYEAAADEFAAVHSIARGHPEDLLAVARLYEAWGRENVQDPRDPHPPMAERAAKMRRLYWGWRMGYGAMALDFYEALDYWTERIAEG